MHTQQIQPLNILQLLTQSDNYQIPVYQRNYAWGRTQIRQLIQDIYDYFSKSADILENYYIGSLVVAKRPHFFEILDGQQRFTTLTLLTCFFKQHCPKYENLQQFNQIKLNFESREQAEFALKALWAMVTNKTPDKSINHLLDEYSHNSILMGYKIISEEAYKVIQPENYVQFVDYLLSNVIILRTIIPEMTDVTHYFDALNNRGEQLEQHEVIKAHLLSFVSAPEDQKDRQLFEQVWHACQDMYRYVQYGFNTANRKKIFGEQYHGWMIQDNRNSYEGYENLKDAYVVDISSDISEEVAYGKLLDLEQILTLPIKSNLDAQQEDGLERFTSIIDFSNFLMHVLKIFVKRRPKTLSTHHIVLDDKLLFDSFKKVITKKEYAQSFIYSLLKLRYLFDTYIVKRENSQQYIGWSLKKIQYYQESKTTSYVNTFSSSNGGEIEEATDLALEGRQRNVVMLLSAFQVSYPTHARKNWLVATLYWLYCQEDTITLSKYLGFLEKFARALICQRYLSIEPQNYEDFMYIKDEHDIKIISKINLAKIDEHLSYKRVSHFCFNYLDYLLLKQKKGAYDKFYFSYKDSIEHFYPQYPKTEQQKLSFDDLNCFGNLSLVSQSENSSLSNDLPIQKIEWLRHKTKAPISLKLQLMMAQTHQSKQSWDVQQIKQHHDDMISILLEDLKMIDQ